MTTNSPLDDGEKKTIVREVNDDEQAERLQEEGCSLTGWRLQTVNIALCLCLFLSTLDSTIVSTSLIAITNDMDGFQKSSWIVTAYLLTYTGFLVIIAKLSDILGRKTLLLVCLIFFLVFSVACGLARSLDELIVFRAFQGIGGGGLYTMVFVILPEMVTPAQYPTYAAVISSVFAIANFAGPMLGGLINNHTTWRWIFYLNGPASAIALFMIWISLPSYFPNRQHEGQKFNLRRIRKIDFGGAFLLLAASLLFVASLEEGGTQYSWSSPAVLVMLLVAIALALAFVAWIKHTACGSMAIESILPWRLASSRFAMAALLNALFGGAVYLSLVINLPLKFQVVDDSSPFDAGYRLLAFTLCTPVGSALAGLFIQKLHIPPLYILLVGAFIQIIGVALMTTLSTTPGAIPAAEYGYQVIMGVGFGANLSTSVMMAPLVFHKKDMAVGMGAVAQFRMLGGSIGLAACTNIVNNHLASATSGVLSSAQLASLHETASVIATLDPSAQQLVKQAYAVGFNQQMQTMVAFSAAAVLAALLLVEKQPRRQL